ncbi:MAG TPA: hypothetical protein VFI23_03920 [Rhizomicrobium sp.]|nr:hypothetical protein [Rhizomicrobium sp.]
MRLPQLLPQGAHCAIGANAPSIKNRDRSGGDRIFGAAGMRRETQPLIPAGETREQEVPLTEETPPENLPGFA